MRYFIHHNTLIMRLHSFRIQNYKSIIDTGEIVLSEHDNITTLAGQNESGKSSALEALEAFEEGEFDEDAKPFSPETPMTPSISCTYTVEESDNMLSHLTDTLRDVYGIENAKDPILKEKMIRIIKKFTLTRSLSEEGNQTLKVDNETFNTLNASIIEVDTDKQENGEVTQATAEKIIDINTEDGMEKVAEIFRESTPNILLFNDFCDLLPNRISLSNLKNEEEDVEGYSAVKNIEKLLDIDFVSMYDRNDLERGSLQDKHNKKISVDFQKSWGQRIYNQNKVEIKYDFQQMSSDKESYINFYTETKDRQRLTPKQRSKGLIWFLSFWLELRAQNAEEQDLIILVDEPGLYLHIKAQEDTMKLFEQIAEEGHQIIYTTHSPHLIDTDKLYRTNLVINDKRKGTLLEPVTISKIDTQNKKDALQPIANAIGFSVSGFGLSHKNAVILEGVSDFYYYSGMRHLLKRKSDYAFLPGIGVRSQKTLISLCIGYGIDWVCISDDDSTRGKDSQKAFDYIKGNMFDGNEPAVRNKIHITDKIPGVENMFKVGDMKLVDKTFTGTNGKVVIGSGRKVMFSKLFNEKAMSGKIKKANISKTAKDNFNKVFDWIEERFSD